MALVTTYQASFAGGMLSPRLRGRVDLQQYAAAAEDLTNVVVQTGGGVARRQGSGWIAAPAGSARVRLVDWRIASDVTYLLEFGALTLRFYRNRALITDGASALELATPWALDELRELTFAASADTLTIFHGSHQPRKLSRTASDTFSLALLELANGPYDTENTGDVPAAATAPTDTPAEGGTTGGEAGAGGGGTWGGDAGGGDAEGSGGGEDGGGEAEAGGGE